uniref:RNase III domain-containing protein n=1 Tax=Solanum lycopersicum TaxID=4081 RepID=A0A3Q7EU42_SOLLC
MLLNHHKVKLCIPTAKILEVMTTKKCHKNFHLESLEKLGKSFLRYAISIQLFKTYDNYHENHLNIKKNKIITNVAFFKLGCSLKASLHEHILHASPDLQRQICYTVENFEKLDIVSTFGWESETTFPIVVGDVVSHREVSCHRCIDNITVQQSHFLNGKSASSPHEL